MSLIDTLFNRKKASEQIEAESDLEYLSDKDKADIHHKTLSFYEPFKLAQRVLAMVVAVPYVLIWVSAAGLLVISGFFEPVLSDQLQRVAKMLGNLNNTTLGVPVSLVLGFYFGGGAIEGVVERIKNARRDD